MRRITIKIGNRQYSILIAALMAMASLAGCQSDTSRTDAPNGTSLLMNDEFASSSDKPPSAETLYRLARVLEAQGKSAQAKSALEATIKRYPKYLPAYCDLAESQVRQRKIGAAILTLKRGLAVDSDDAVLLNNLGMCRLLQGDNAQARENFESAAAAAPNDARYQSNLALATAMLGQYDESLELYKQILSGGQAHYNVAVACEARNDSARADIEYATAARLDSSLKRLSRTP